MYVTELFGGRVSRVRPDGSVTTVIELADPAAVEYEAGQLWVTYDVFANGTVATVG